HHWHAAHGTHFADRDGWQVVAAYLGADQEVEAARTGLALADISAFAKVSLRGPGLPALVPSLLPSGAAVNLRGVSFLHETAAIACRLTEDHLLCQASTGNASMVER